jgi:hypothetical protein
VGGKKMSIADRAKEGKREKKRTGDDGALGLVLGDEAGGVSGSRHDEDGTGVLLDSSGDGGHGNGLGGRGRADGHSTELVKEGRVADGGLGEEAGLGHHLDCGENRISTTERKKEGERSAPAWMG